MLERTKNLNFSAIKEMEKLASVMPDAISLAQGIPNFDTPEFIKIKAQEAMDRGEVARYSTPQGLPLFRKAISLALSEQNINYDWQSETLVTAGSIEALTASLMAVTMPGDEVIVFDPSYSGYNGIITLAGCTPVYVALDETNGWSLDLEKLDDAITKKTKAIIVCNPNNPTGTFFDKNQLMAIGDLALRHNIYILVDEVYKEFIFDNNNQPAVSLAEFSQYKENLITIFSFSKSFAMTGWRIGYLISNSKIVNETIKIHDSLVNCAPVISQHAAMAALEMKNSERRDIFASYAAARELICSRLDKLSTYFSYVKPNSTYYIFPKILFTNKNSIDFAHDLLNKAHVAVVPGIAFGPQGENHIRLNFGGKIDDINKAFDRMEKYLEL